MVLPAEPVRLVGVGLVLREWESTDVERMSELFDEPDIADRTPLATPFDLAAAREYLERAQSGREKGERIHLAITADGDEPLGEIMLNLVNGTMGYMVGRAHRGQRLTVRAGELLTAYAHEVLGLSRVVLEIEGDNRPSVAVAKALGFHQTGDAPQEVQGKYRMIVLETWAHDAPADADVR